MPTRNLETLSQTIRNKLDKIENLVEQELLGNYRVALEAVRKELGEVFRKYAKAGVLTKAEMTKYNRMTVLEKKLVDILGPTLGKNGRLINRLSETQYQESFFRNAWAIEQSTGVSLKWGQLSEATIKAAVENDLSKIAQMGARVNDLVGIRRTMTQGLIQGSSYPKMAKDMKEFLDRSASGYVRIARTEGNRAAAKGQLDNYDKAEDLGLEMQKVWIATLDKATRPSHGHMDGQVADENGKFLLRGQLIDGPMDDSLPPEELINCRCRIVTRVAELPPEKRRIRDEGVQDYINYDDWAKERGIKRNKYGQKV